LKSNGVVFRSEPYGTDELCKGEWDTAGSCCSFESTLDYVELQKIKITTVLERANVQVEFTQSDLQKYSKTFHRFLRYRRRSKKFFRRLTNFGMRARTAKSTRKALGKQLKPKLKELISWLKENKNYMVVDQTKCLNRLHEVRMSSVCYTCSARASLYFERDELRLHESTCRGLIAHCASSWNYLIEFLDRVNSVYNLVRKMEARTGIRFKDAVKGSPASSILDWADKNNFRTLLKNCNDGQCQFENAKKICDNFVSITSPIYLKAALRIVGNMNRKSRKWRRYLRKKNKQLKKMLTNDADKDLYALSKTRDRKRRRGRNLLLKSPLAASSLVGRKPLQALKPNQTEPVISASESSGGNQNASFNPLLCPGSTICIADKVVLTVSKCTISGILCASPAIQFALNSS